MFSFLAFLFPVHLILYVETPLSMAHISKLLQWLFEMKGSTEPYRQLREWGYGLIYGVATLDKVLDRTDRTRVRFHHVV